MSGYDHNEIVRKVYAQLRQRYDGATLVAKKDGTETEIGQLIVQRRHWDGERGAPDVVLLIRRFSLLHEEFDSVPLALVEVEKKVSSANQDFKNFIEGCEDNKPTIVITDSETISTRIQEEGAHLFDVKAFPHGELEKRT